ncbi:MAG TPA: TlpA disulfide reductase family protein [Bryobacteraceae bacterium]|jgi:peroxiredoxin|nr:TlpA disulfide reductase family protein [Bryobacteraceae bacterium]
MMRRVWAASVLGAVLAWPGQAAGLPRPAPEFVIRNQAGQALLSQFRGKVVLLAFIHTTCPHCQNSIGILSRIQNEYGTKGLQVLASAFDELAPQALPEFVTRFRPTFPVGYASRSTIHDYLQIASNVPFNVPIYLFIDKKGVIQAQHMGGGKFFQDEERNTRITIDALLKEPAAPGKSGKKKPAPPGR